MRCVIKLYIISHLLICYSMLFAGEMEPALNPRHATVKIRKTFIRPNYCIPWKMIKHSSSGGSGVVISGNLILTNAHVVSDSSFIQVQKENDPKRYEADVLYIGHECDLALVRVRDERFYNGILKLKFGGIPRMKSLVATYGYPVGGERISITEGVVSRIEMGVYSHSRKLGLLMIQTDAAINPGNSGGPVIQDGKIAGIAFQARSNSNNIGYMIPVPIIMHFIKDVSDGRFDGFPDMGIFTDELLNESYREYLGMTKDQTGIIVTHVVNGGSADGQLERDDVIMSIDANTIANDGSIAFSDGRIKYSYIVDQKQMGESITLKILRNKQIMSVTFPLPHFPERIPWFNEYETLPRYFIFGGIVFQPLNREYLKCWDKWWYNADRRMLYYYSYQEEDNIYPERKEFIVINHILPDAVNTYVSNIRDMLVEKINGIKITGLDDVIKAVEKPLGLFHVIEIEGNSKPIILKASGLKEANKRILKKYQIPWDRRLDRNSGYKNFINNTSR